MQNQKLKKNCVSKDKQQFKGPLAEQPSPELKNEGALSQYASDRYALQVKVPKMIGKFTSPLCIMHSRNHVFLECIQ